MLAPAIRFISCTIAGNRGGNGNGIYNASRANQITLINTLLWNSGTSDEITGNQASVTFDHSLSRDGITGNVQIDGVDQLTADPGRGFDHSLVTASPARDTGTLSLYANPDLDGEFLTDGLKDIGADEFTDSDGDGLPDWIETLSGIDLSASGDQDNDTLTNLDDFNAGANPLSNDTDADGLLDGDELYGDGTHGDTDGYVTEPSNADTDGDGLNDGWEAQYGLDPLDDSTGDSDFDSDGLLTSEEYALGTNPTADDTDGDGLKDGIEGSILASIDPSNYYYLDPTNPDTDGDGINDGLDSDDGDALSNLDELALGTNPNVADTDGDGGNDSTEVTLGTDPLIANDFANQDSDGDGLNDLFEITFGTDPNNADTNGNGMDDGEELDNGGDPINPGPPPEPLNPGTPPGADPPPPPTPPAIIPGNYTILVEPAQISFPKHGHSTFQSTDPAKRYLTLSAQQSFSGGNPESGPDNENGSKAIEIDPVTGESTTSGDSFVNTGGNIESPTRKSGESETSSYDDPPNQVTDNQATIRYFSTLSNENTTTMMQTNGKAELEDYSDTFTSGTPHAYRNVHANELRYDYHKVQFKFKWETGIDESQKFPIKCHVLFIPENDPDTPENEEETQMEIVDTIEWNGSGDESAVKEIDPESLKPGEDGRYQLLKMDVAVDLNNDGEIDNADRSLQSTGENTGATPREIELATEYIFDNDGISNGLWDSDSSAAPSSITEDDDAEAIKISINGLNVRAIWLEHPGINQLKFYSSKELNSEDEIVFPFDLTQDTSVFDNPIYAKLTWPTGSSVKQVDGDLVLKFGNLDKTDAISVSKVRFNLIREYGAEDYFNAARDYIYENNTDKYVDVKTYTGAITYTIVVFSEQLSSMQTYNAYDNANDTAIAKGIDEVLPLNSSASIVINGNFSENLDIFARMTRETIGEYVFDSNLLVPPSNLRFADLSNPSWGYVGYDNSPSKYSFLEGRQVSSNTDTPPTRYGLGGLRVDYSNGVFNAGEAGGLVGYFEEPSVPEYDNLFFIAMSSSGASHTKVAIDAAQSRVPRFSSGQLKLFILDGSSSVALAMEDPSGTMRVPIKGRKHTLGIPYYINSYFIFETQKPR